MVALANRFGASKGTSTTVWWTLFWIVKSSVGFNFYRIKMRTLAPLLVLFQLTRTQEPMVLCLLPVKDQYLWICSDKFFARVCCVWNIFAVASSPDCDAFRYIISRKSSDSIFNVQWESHTSCQRSRWLLFRTLADVLHRRYGFPHTYQHDHVIHDSLLFLLT